MAKKITIKKSPNPGITKEAASGKKLTAKQFIERLKALQSDEELKKIQRYFKSGEGQYGEGDKFMGVKMDSYLHSQLSLVKCLLLKLKNCWKAPSTKREPGPSALWIKHPATKKSQGAAEKNFMICI